MNRKLYSLLLLLALSTGIFAQQENTEEDGDDDEPTGFRRENIFLGGGISVAGGTGLFALGLTPEIGYSVWDWLDIGPAFNFNYTSQRYYINNIEVKQKSTIIGAGMFLRVYPFNPIFIQLQPEHNWIKIKLENTSNNAQLKYDLTAMSVLGGVGYSQRVIGENNFYIMMMIDLMQEVNSPYRDSYNKAIPFFRSGFNIYLNPKKRK